MLVYQRVPPGKLTYVDPENQHFLMETSLNQPLSARVELLIYWRVTMINNHYH